HFQAHERRYHRQCDTGITAGSLHQVVTGFYFSAVQRTPDHSERCPVFHASPGIIPFKLAEYLHILVGRYMLKLNQRRISDEFLKLHIDMGLGLLFIMLGFKNNNICFYFFAIVHFGLIINFRMRGDTTRQPHISTDDAVMSDHSIASQNRGSCIDNNMIFQRRMTFPDGVVLTNTEGAQGYALVYFNMVSNDSRFTNYDTCAVVDAKI